jgi:hypothetical protein
VHQARKSPAEIRHALDLVGNGLTHAEIATQLDVPVGTLRTWLYRGPPRRVIRPGCATCGAEHDLAGADADSYAYLLGVYLGDGYLASQGGGPRSLRVAMDVAYPGIIEEVAQAICAVRGQRPWVGRDRRTNTVRIVSYWREWPCWFPQYGAGRKHERRIELETWQRAHVEMSPGAFLRGLIHSDGWRGVNRVRVKNRDYAYPRYQFSNRSEDIRRLFTDACELLGVAWRPWGRYHVSVARSRDVALLDRFVGPKA